MLPLIIGDALHNLKNALDILYLQAIEATFGRAESHTRFPFRSDRKELEDAINGGPEEAG